jgi:hypothetical protein
MNRSEKSTGRRKLKVFVEFHLPQLCRDAAQDRVVTYGFKVKTWDLSLRFFIELTEIFGRLARIALELHARRQRRANGRNPATSP